MISITSRRQVVTLNVTMYKSQVKRPSPVIATTLLAILLFSLLFAGITFGFWVQLSLSISALCVLAYVHDRTGVKKLFTSGKSGFLSTIIFGTLSAAVLYALFYGFRLLAEYMFSFAHNEIVSVYTLKDNVNVGYIALLLIVIIGPGEEVFWRGYVQRNFTKQFGFVGVILSVIAYTAAHLVSGNLMLIAAAAVCGVFWSLMFWHFKSIWLNIISHVVWDVAVFVLWPLT